MPLFAPTNEAIAAAGYDIDVIITDADLCAALIDTVALGALNWMHSRIRSRC